jgi:hypothetical protein
MSQILEHVSDVNSWMRNAWGLLKRGGTIAIALPNFNSMFRLVLGRRDPYIIPPEHLNFFSTGNLKALLSKHGFKVIREENFGPIMTLIRAQDAEDAVARANATHFGLTASIWTRDLDRGVRLAERLEAGTVAVNQPVGSVAQCPWGGVKHSGIGRLLGLEGMREFTQTVNLRLPI